MSLRFILTPLQPACDNSVVLCLPYPSRSAIRFEHFRSHRFREPRAYIGILRP